MFNFTNLNKCGNTTVRSYISLNYVSLPPYDRSATTSADTPLWNWIICSITAEVAPLLAWISANWFLSVWLNHVQKIQDESQNLIANEAFLIQNDNKVKIVTTMTLMMMIWQRNYVHDDWWWLESNESCRPEKMWLLLIKKQFTHHVDGIDWADAVDKHVGVNHRWLHWKTRKNKKIKGKYFLTSNTFILVV